MVAPVTSVVANDEMTTWMDPIIKYIELGSLLADAREATQIRRKGPLYSVIKGGYTGEGFHYLYTSVSQENNASMSWLKTMKESSENISAEEP